MVYHRNDCFIFVPAKYPWHCFRSNGQKLTVSLEYLSYFSVCRWQRSSQGPLVLAGGHLGIAALSATSWTKVAGGDFWHPGPMSIQMIFKGTSGTCTTRDTNNNSSHTFIGGQGIGHWENSMDEAGKFLTGLSWVENFADTLIWTHNLPTQSILLLPITLP